MGGRAAAETGVVSLGGSTDAGTTLALGHASLTGHGDISKACNTTNEMMILNYI